MIEDVFFGIGEKFLHEVLEMVRFTHEICMVGSKAVYKVGIICDKVLDVEDILPQQTAVSPVKNSLVKCFINANNKNISLLDPDILVRTNR